MKTIGITGANGFLGSYTTRAAIDRKWYVKSIIRSEKSAKLVQNLGAEAIVIKDLQTEEFFSSIKDCDALLHFIGITSPQQGSFNEINVGLTKKIVNYVQDLQIPRLIVLSGLGVDQYNKKAWATNPYFYSKSQIEKICQKSPIDYIIFRPSYIIGPGDELLPSIIASIQAGKVMIPGDGTSPMQPVSVHDAINAFLNAAEGIGPSRSIYDLVGPEILSMNSLISRIYALYIQEILKNKSTSIPSLNIEYISLDDAVIKLGISKEEVDVTQCEVIGNNSTLQTELKIQLTPLNLAILETIKSTLGEK